MRNNSFIKFLNHARMSGFQIGMGLTSVLVGGTLNRVMIVELGIPASLVGLFYALPLLISPFRVWLGYRSDAFPLWGLRREPYIIFGSFFAGLGVVLAALILLNGGAGNILLILAALLSFVIYSLGYNLSSNTFEALLADKFEGAQRPRAVTFFKITMLVGVMGGAVGLGKLLDPFSPQRMMFVVFGVAIIAFVLAILSTLGQEPREEQIKQTNQDASQVPFSEIFKKLVWADPQVRKFFIFVMLTVVGTLAQDVLLEPFGALVLNMSVAQTTRLTSQWGAGSMLAMILAGSWLINRYGYRVVLRAGLFLGVAVFFGFILAGILQSTHVFIALVFCLGISTGFSAAGMMTAVIEFTTRTHAGLLMGVWGVAHEVGQALGSLVSGVIVDLGRLLSGGDALFSYGLVFVLEAVMLIAAVQLLKQVDISQSTALQKLTKNEPQTNTTAQITA